MPFRDKASQHFLKPTYRRGKEKEEAEGSEEQEPECEPTQVPPYEDVAADERLEDALDEEEDGEEEEQEWVPDMPPDGPPRPSVEEYQTRWDKLKAWHSRPVEGPFGKENLVPHPEPQLWQAMRTMIFEIATKTALEILIIASFISLGLPVCAV